MVATPTPAQQDLINSQAFWEAPNSLQRRTEYNGSGLPLYIGFAAHGFATSAPAWTIYKITYDASNLETLKQTALKVAWDNRATETYA